MPAERARREPPSLDRTVYCHANALAVSSLLKAAAVLQQPSGASKRWRPCGSCSRTSTTASDVFHYWDGTYHLPGMLGDQAHLIRALIDASQHTGDADLLLPAEAIAERAIQKHKAPSGGFYDILHDPGNVGSMRRRNRSILDNATMAESLVRLSYLSRRPEFYHRGHGGPRVVRRDYKEYGYYVAGYGRAIDLIFYEPLFLTIVGDRTPTRRQNCAARRSPPTCRRASCRRWTRNTTRSCSAAVAIRSRRSPWSTSRSAEPTRHSAQSGRTARGDRTHRTRAAAIAAVAGWASLRRGASPGSRPYAPRT
jgi:uncharacterized protein YyaL (SSP411 family)